MAKNRKSRSSQSTSTYSLPIWVSKRNCN